MIGSVFGTLARFSGLSYSDWGARDPDQKRAVRDAQLPNEVHRFILFGRARVGRGGSLLVVEP